MNANQNKFLIIALLLPLILILRLSVSSPAFPSDESYHNLRVADLIREKTVVSEDPLGSNPSFNLLNYILAFLPIWIKYLLPVLLGLLTAFYFYRLVDKQHNALSTALLFASPMFLAVFTQLTSIMLGAFLAVYSLNLLKNRKMLQLSIVLVLLILTSFPIWLALASYLVFRFRIYPAVIPSLIFTPWVFNLQTNAQQLFTEFGASFGISIFLFFLALIGFVWRKKNPSRAFLLIAAIVLAYWFVELRIMLAFIIAIYAGRAILKLSNRTWDVPQLKAVTLYLVFLIIAFSAASATANLVRENPTNTEVYTELSNLPYGKVFSQPEQGHLIQYFAKYPTIVDSTSTKTEILRAQEILDSQNSEDTSNYFSEKEVTYILLPASESRKGIYFLLDNDPRYIIAYEEDFELWILTPRTNR